MSSCASGPTATAARSTTSPRLRRLGLRRLRPLPPRPRRDRRRAHRRHRGHPRPRRGQGEDHRRRLRLRRARRPHGRLRAEAPALRLRPERLRLVGDRHHPLHPRRLHRPRQGRPPRPRHRPRRHHHRTPAARAPTPATSTPSRWRSATSPTASSSPRSSPRSGNWSSYPPHRHDEDDFPRMTYLEETYYHRLNPAAGFGLQRVFTEDGTPRRDDGRRRTTTSSSSPKATTPAPPPTASTSTTSTSWPAPAASGASRTTPTSTGSTSATTPPPEPAPALPHLAFPLPPSVLPTYRAGSPRPGGRGGRGSGATRATARRGPARFARGENDSGAQRRSDRPYHPVDSPRPPALRLGAPEETGSDMTERVVLTYGDCNTHGTPPIATLEDLGRHGPDARWPGVLRADSFQISADRRYTKGLKVGFAYTLGKSEDNGSDKRNVLYNTYDDTGTGGRRATTAATCWPSTTSTTCRSSGRSRASWRICSAAGRCRVRPSSAPARRSRSFRPARTSPVWATWLSASRGTSYGDPKANTNGKLSAGSADQNFWFNPAAFARPAPGTFGNAPAQRDLQPGRAAVGHRDLQERQPRAARVACSCAASSSTSRTTRTWRTCRPAPSTALPWQTRPAANFGRVTSKTGQRDIQLSVRFQF